MKTFLVLSSSLSGLCSSPRTLCIGPIDTLDIASEIWKGLNEMEIFDKGPATITSRDLILKIGESFPSPEQYFVEKKPRTYPKIPPKVLGSQSKVFRSPSGKVLSSHRNG